MYIIFYAYFNENMTLLQVGDDKIDDEIMGLLMSLECLP